MDIDIFIRQRIINIDVDMEIRVIINFINKIILDFMEIINSRIANY